MSTVAAGLGKLLSSGEKVAGLLRKGAGLVKAAESSPAAVARFEESSAEATREMLKDSYAAVRALVAQAIGREPSHPEVDAVFAEVAEHPNAPFRFHRLLGEARKSASRRRRRFLASVAFGLEFSTMPDDERDRVDMAVERMTVPDVALLMHIEELDNTSPQLTLGVPDVFDSSQVAALIFGLEVRIATTKDYRHDDENADFDTRVYGDDYRPDLDAFGSLVSIGCLDIGQSQASQDVWEVHRLMITQLGRLVIRAIEEVRPGFATATE